MSDSNVGLLLLADTAPRLAGRLTAAELMRQTATVDEEVDASPHGLVPYFSLTKDEWEAEMASLESL